MRYLLRKIEYIFILLLSIVCIYLLCSCTPINEVKNFTVSYYAGEGGKIQGEAEQKVNYEENATTVTAVANEGYRFVGWSDGIETATRTDKAVTKDINVTARFEKLSYKVSYSTDGNGSIRGEATQTVKYKENATTVTAIANEGYRFVGWSDGIETATRTERVVTSNKEVTARFEKLSYKLSYSTDGNGSIQGEANQTIKYQENATTVTAVADEGYRFVGWSDGIETATRTDESVTKNISVTARFEKIIYQVIYQTAAHLYGFVQDVNAVYPDVTQPTLTLKFSIAHGDSAPIIRACPRLNDRNESFVFMYWSDGVTTEERQDTNITSDKTVTAYFGYTIEYKAEGHGKIEGKTEQKLLPDGTGEGVKAIPDNGYEFCGWSDLSRETQRNGDSVKQSAHRNYAVWEYVAYFEPVKKTFHYDYGIADGSPYVTEITLNRNDIESAEFIVPEYEGYKFCGWYADIDYRTRITMENGRYMYGYAAFTLSTDTLYARWQKEGEEADPHKVLLIFVDEIQTTLHSTVIDQDIDVHSKMTALDYQLGSWMTETIYELLNEWFEGIQEFEVDAYYTVKVVTGGFTSGLTSWYDICYGLKAPEINEVSVLAYSYHNTITVIGLDDNKHYLYMGNGQADQKNADVSRDRTWELAFNNTPLQIYLENFKNGSIDLNQTLVETCMHEFAHTAEMNYELGYDLHTVLGYAITKYGYSSITNAIKPYLLGEFEMDGTLYGVPMDYWKHKDLIHIEYLTRPVNGLTVGSILAIEDGGEPGNGVGRNLIYRSDISVEAIPNEGYRFIKWSDGITTAIRHDKNIIAYYRVEAIFEKI